MTALTLFMVSLVSLALLKLCTSCLSARRKYIQAKKIGLPVIFTPMTRGVIWMVLEPLVSPFIRRLPFGLGNWLEYCKSGLLFRSNLHERFGPAFLLVSPWETVLVLVDAEAVDDVFHRRNDFGKSAKVYRTLNIFGDNVVSVNGEAWKRHRRITTPPFNERNSSLVWRESVSQADGMIKFWTKQENTGVKSTSKDTMALALNVLMGAGFGKSYSFAGEKENGGGGLDEEYRDSLGFVLNNLASAVIGSRIPLLAYLFPSSKFGAVKKASSTFRSHMAKMVEAERNVISEKGLASDNLMSTLVRAADAEKGDGRAWNSLTDDEIFGNLFVYNVAGHDTTARTLAYAITVLSAHPKIQEWLRKEIRTVLGPQSSGTNWEYEKAFPQLKRCLALMYETLRLYPAVISVPRTTDISPQFLKIEGEEYLLPPHTHVNCSMTGMHTRTEYWGPDALEFRPQRWIITPDSSNPSDAQTLLSQEHHVTPKPGTFTPWISGPRICPGKKFSQVEFVAVVASIFGKYKVSPMLLEGETLDEAGERVMRAAEDSYNRVTLRMREPEKICFQWAEV